MLKKFWRARFFKYYHQHGFIGTVGRIFREIWLVISKKRFVLYYVDLPISSTDKRTFPSNVQVLPKYNMEEINTDEMNVLASYRGIDVIKYHAKKRFDKGAILWLAKIDGKTAGMIWSLRGRTMEPYYFFLTDNDVHLFDNEIFKDYRGGGINTVLIERVLLELKNMGAIRAFISTNLRNKAEQRSLGKTSFKKFALARKFHILNRDISIWSKTATDL